MVLDPGALDLQGKGISPPGCGSGSKTVCTCFDRLLYVPSDALGRLLLGPPPRMRHLERKRVWAPVGPDPGT